MTVRGRGGRVRPSRPSVQDRTSNRGNEAEACDSASGIAATDNRPTSGPRRSDVTVNWTIKNDPELRSDGQNS